MQMTLFENLVHVLDTVDKSLMTLRPNFCHIGWKPKGSLEPLIRKFMSGSVIKNIVIILF